MRLFLTILALVPSLALANNEPPSTELFACTFQGGQKAVRIDLYDSTVRYRFGKPGQMPELVLLRDVRQAAMTPWNGFGGSIWDEIAITNQGVTYIAASWVDRRANGGAGAINGTLLVMRGSRQLAELQCDRGSLRGDVYQLFDAKEKAGQFWCQSTISWTDRACKG
jgi:hypothetical protein